MNHKQNVIPTRLTCKANTNLSSIINKFPNTHTPLFVYGDKNEFIGLITVRSTFLNKRHNPSTLVRSCLISPPRITSNTPINEVLRSMSSLKLYTLPVFNNHGAITSLIEAKAILKDLMHNQSFAEAVTQKDARKTTITIGENNNMGDALKVFSSHAISKLVVVDKKNKVKGIITKRDILSLYFAPTNRQRFSTRSSTKNYSFDTEQINRDQQPLIKYVTPVLNTLYVKTNIFSTIHNLLDSPYNSVILVDKARRPIMILTTNDLISIAVKITSKKPYLPSIISKLPKEVNQTEKNKVNQYLRKTALWINRQHEFIIMHFVTKIVYSSEKTPVLFEVKLKITTKSTTFFARNKDRSFLQATREAIKQIKKQVTRFN
jgi:CBS-domain-containing membrane protein/ribosome-associated translation inhibitor RaiA